jgi:glycosyltransferase involved in cell wall biosynthesis
VSIEHTLASVAMITYNHRPYIAQALDSVIAQERDFPIEIVISDDHSSDGTARVIDDYQGRYPDLIRRLDPPANVGPCRNLARVWSACTGKYIALLEGDDWWRDGKLAAQVKFMECHPECAISGHQSTRVSDHGLNLGDWPVGWPETFGIDFLIKGSCLPTASIMCRHGVLKTLPGWALGLRLADWPLCLLHSMKGQVGFIRCPLSYYRMHAGGVWSSLGTERQLTYMLEAALEMSLHVPAAHKRRFEGAVGYFHHHLFESYRDTGAYWMARRHLWSSLVHRVRGRDLRLRWLCALPARVLLPSLGKRSPSR